MRYYLDTEFDCHGGPLLSIALVGEVGTSIHIRTEARASDLWVQKNVEPLMDSHNASYNPSNVRMNAVGSVLRQFLDGDADPVIVADSVVDIGRFCAAISTGEDGGWASFDGSLRFEVHDVSCYPTTLPGAVQHNAWWDAMALRHTLRFVATSPKEGDQILVRMTVEKAATNDYRGLYYVMASDPYPDTDSKPIPVMVSEIVSVKAA